MVYIARKLVVFGITYLISGFVKGFLMEWFSDTKEKK